MISHKKSPFDFHQTGFPMQASLLDLPYARIIVKQ